MDRQLIHGALRMTQEKNHLTVDPHRTIQRRVKRDRAFARALRKEASDLRRAGEVEAALLIEKLSEATPRKTPKERKP
jgi:hypothetical protein